MDENRAVDIARTAARKAGLTVTGVAQAIYAPKDSGSEAVGILGSNWFIYLTTDADILIEDHSNIVAVLVNQETGHTRFLPFV